MAELSEQKTFHAPSTSHAPGNGLEVRFEHASTESDTVLSRFSSNREALYVARDLVDAVWIELTRHWIQLSAPVVGDAVRGRYLLYTRP